MSFPARGSARGVSLHLFRSLTPLVDLKDHFLDFSSMIPCLLMPEEGSSLHVNAFGDILTYPRIAKGTISTKKPATDVLFDAANYIIANPV